MASRRRGLISYPINAFEDLLREIAAGHEDGVHARGFQACNDLLQVFAIQDLTGRDVWDQDQLPSRKCFCQFQGGFEAPCWRARDSDMGSIRDLF